jgi:hypothetical protein
MYVAHPFRLYGVGKDTDITLAQQAYAERHSPCNDGWCQDIIQAAMLVRTTCFLCPILLSWPARFYLVLPAPLFFLTDLRPLRAACGCLPPQNGG